jgi:hypothetical protein
MFSHGKAKVYIRLRNLLSRLLSANNRRPKSAQALAIGVNGKDAAIS